MRPGSTAAGVRTQRRAVYKVGVWRLQAVRPRASVCGHLRVQASRASLLRLACCF